MHTHSWYSLLEGASSPDALLARAAACGYAALALTDSNNLYGAAAFVEAAKRRGVRPLLGACLRQHRTHCVALVAEPAGWRSLCRVLSRPAPAGEDAAAAGPLRGNAEGLHVLADDLPLAERLRDAFGRRLWLEVVRPGRGDRPRRETSGRRGATGRRPPAGPAARRQHRRPLRRARGLPRLPHGYRRAPGTLLDRLPRDLAVTPDHHLVDRATLRRRFRDLPEALRNLADLAERLSVRRVAAQRRCCPRRGSRRGLEPAAVPAAAVRTRPAPARPLRRPRGPRAAAARNWSIIEAAGLAAVLPRRPRPRPPRPPPRPAIGPARVGGQLAGLLPARDHGRGPAPLRPGAGPLPPHRPAGPARHRPRLRLAGARRGHRPRLPPLRRRAHGDGQLAPVLPAALRLPRGGEDPRPVQRADHASWRATRAEDEDATRAACGRPDRRAAAGFPAGAVALAAAAGATPGACWAGRTTCPCTAAGWSSRRGPSTSTCRSSGRRRAWSSRSSTRTASRRPAW